MAHHRLESDTANLHGYFSRDLKPVLEIESGDTVEFITIPDAAWNSRCKRFEGDEPVRVDRRDPEYDRGHCLSGPIFVRGAKPGHTLEVVIEEIVPADHGWTSSGGWSHPVHQYLGLVNLPEVMLYWKLDRERALGVDQFGHEVDLRPFLGVMGMPQDIPGVQATPPPRRTGGNLDCKELVAGNSLFLPIEIAGGLFSTGDGHAAQGDGEVCVTAVECPMEKVVLTFHLHPEMEIDTPRVRTKDAWITLGVSEDLDEAVMIAIQEMVGILGDRFAVDRTTALALASVAADVRVTQIVNGVKGAHVVLRDSAIRKTLSSTE